MPRRSKHKRRGGASGSGSSENYDSGNRSGGGLVRRFSQNPTIFGNVYRTVLKTMYQYSATGSTTYVLTWKANSTHLIGPQIGYTGSFGSASPTGLYNLLSSSTSSGSTAPYNRYRIRSSAIRIFVTPVGTNTTAGLVACFPSSNLSFSSTTTSQFVEQPLCKRAAIQIDADSSKPLLVLEQKVGALYGVPQSAVVSESNWWGSAGGDPNLIEYWQVFLGSVDGSTAFSCNVGFELYQEVEFFGRNQLIATAV
jgi:hypothetical protein